MINLYYVRYGKAYVSSCATLEDAFATANYHFYEGYSCCQTVIDEDKQAIYTLTGDIEVDIKFYEFQHNRYNVVNTDYFDEDITWILSGTYIVQED